MSNLLKYNSQTARYPLRRHCLSPLADCFIRHSTFFVVNYFPKITEITKTLFQEMSRDRSEDSTRATISLLRLLSLILFFVTDVKSSPRFNLEQMPREIEGGSSWSLRKNLIDACICLSRVYLSWPSRYRRYYGGGFERKKKKQYILRHRLILRNVDIEMILQPPFRIALSDIRVSSFS